MMMTGDLQRAYDLLRGESFIWAMAPEQIQALAVRMAGTESARSLSNNARPPVQAPLSTAVIPIVGPLVRRGSYLSEAFGFSSYSQIRSALSTAIGDQSIDHLLLYVDSPGGIAQGCEECAADIVGAARKKKLTVWIDGMAASAGYWLASAAPKTSGAQIIATPSSEVGSVGVFLLAIEYSEAMRAAGISHRFIVSKISPNKVEGNPFEKMSEETVARFQQQVDAVAAKFVGSISRGRGVSRTKVVSDFGKGSVLSAEDALAAMMIDRLSSDFNDALRAPSMSGRSAAADRRELLASFDDERVQRRLELQRLR